jgi:hypothetical protein
VSPRLVFELRCRVLGCHARCSLLLAELQLDGAPIAAQLSHHTGWCLQFRPGQDGFTLLAIALCPEHVSAIYCGSH